LFKALNWLLVFTAGYWSFTVAYLLLLFEDLADTEQGGPDLQTDPAQRNWLGDSGESEHFDAVAAKDQLGCPEPVLAREHDNVNVVEFVQPDADLFGQSKTFVNHDPPAGDPVAPIDKRQQLPDEDAEA